MSDTPSLPSPADASDAADAGLRIEYPPALPISARVDEIASAIRHHQVVIVAGATGSGKTTQLPKVALQLRRGLAPQRIGVTQPRRIAATSVSARVATELGCALGKEVGYQIRFEDRTSDATRVKFMTDGVLLAEIQADRRLRRYDTLIIDEAHERSLNIDFLLGWLKRLLPKRPEFKLIVSSATLETERFADFFGAAPVIEVEGRTYPVEVLYEPPEPELELPRAAAQGVETVTSLDPQGDVLVFLPGEREIRETERLLLGRRLRHTTIQPLYSRLSSAEQRRIFAPVTGRRVILATNVAETSLTLPGIVYVVDTGVARLSRYDPRSGTTRLQVEPISRASAEQRKGRCGRVREGLCLRLYDEQDFASRSAYTDPEIKRTGLAAVILRMKALGLGAVEDFPFLDAPQSRAINEGYHVLEELGALDERRELTKLGRQLARFPVDPRIARMVLAGVEFGCLDEMLVLSAALELMDPRERPHGEEQRADAAHQRFRDESSDFVSYLKLWAFVSEARAKGTSHLKRTCKQHFLSFVRVREWFEVHRQLRAIVEELGLRDGASSGGGRRRRRRRGRLSQAKNEAGPRGDALAPTAPGRGPVTQVARSTTASRAAGAAAETPLRVASRDFDTLHKALLSGLLSRIGQYEPRRRVYLGARQTRFVLHPSSVLARKPPPWVVAYELVQTSQLFARTAARIDPRWLDAVAGHLLKRSHGQPYWAQRAGRAKIKENATLYGLPVFQDRSVDYASVAPGRARLMFIEHALVRGEYQTRATFQAKNRALLDEVARLRDKARRSDMLADPDALLDFFDRRLPKGVTCGKTFEDWRAQAEREDPSILLLSTEEVLRGEPELRAGDYPDELHLRGSKLPLHYRFDPFAEDDGITVVVPLALLTQLDPGELDWTIPAWHRDKIAALLERLPKRIRKEVGAVGPLALRLAERLVPFEGAMIPALQQAVEAETGVRVEEAEFALDALPGYLRLTCQVVDEQGRVVYRGRELQRWLAEHQGRARVAFRTLTEALGWERSGITSWDFGELPEWLPCAGHAGELRAYPALRDGGGAVDLVLVESPDQARAETERGLRRLLAVSVQRQLQALSKQVPPPFPRADGLPHGQKARERFRAQFLERVVGEAFELERLAELPRTRAAFEQLRTQRAGQLGNAFERLRRAVGEVSAELARLHAAVRKAQQHPSGARAVADIQQQLSHLFPEALLLEVALERLAQYPRYLKAAQLRLARATANPRKDAEKLAAFAPLWEALLHKLPAARCVDEAAALRWDMEELRISVFAPEIRPAVSVSAARLARAIEALQ